jgi:hypothetical protein
VLLSKCGKASEESEYTQTDCVGAADTGGLLNDVRNNALTKRRCHHQIEPRRRRVSGRMILIWDNSAQAAVLRLPTYRDSNLRRRCASMKLNERDSKN